MNRTTKITSALATFGVLPPTKSRPESSDIDDVLAVANEYRLALVDLHQERHEAIVQLRDKLFPGLFRAMVTSEAITAEIYETERAIKAHHSDARDKNAVTPEQREKLDALRKARVKAKQLVTAEKKPWLELFKSFRGWWKELANWKNVKTLSKRKELYAGLTLPDGPVGEYARLWMDMDLRERDLDREFAPRLHPTIRAEIKEASQPKLGKDSPGIRYHYGRTPDVRPWEKLSLQFAGGLTVATAIAGASQLSLTPQYTNHRSGGDVTTYLARQQIGTKVDPRWAEYLCVVHRPLPADAIIQRWSLVVRDGKRTAIPIFANLDSKPTGAGIATYKLRWTIRKEAIEVAHIWGDHVNERVLVPLWIVERILRVKDEQAICDLRCNELLSRRGATPEAGSKQGMEALAVYAQEYPLDNAIANLLHECQRTMHLVRKDAASARRAIEDIYGVVANRVCRLHGQIVHDDIDLSRIKKYDKRDLLREDVLPERSREILAAVSPGKLRERLKRGKHPASDDVPAQPPETARDTDHWTSYISSMGRKTGTKENAPRRCSRHGSAVLAAE